MKILYVNNILPFPTHDGGRMRRYHLARSLAEEHEVWMLGAAPDEEALREFQRRNPRIRFVRIEFKPEQGRVRVAEAARELLSRERFDAVHIAELWQWPGSRALQGQRVVLDAENVESLLHRRLLQLKGQAASHPDLLAVHALERQAFKRADAILSCSEHDAAVIRQMEPGAQVAVVPNGVDLDQYPIPAFRAPKEAPNITFIGLLSYAPNADAATYFAREIWPRIRSALPAARFRIVGRYPPAEVMELRNVPGVDVIPDVPEILPYFHSADVLAVPLRAGSGTRLKIIEAMASGCPVISTPVGCEGLAVKEGEHLLVAGDPERFAELAVRLVTHPEEGARLRDAGRRLVEARYTWRQSRDELLRAYAELPLSGHAVG